MTHSLRFNCTGETAAQAATAALARRGLRVVRSFDLHSVLTALARTGHDASYHGPCLCPYHGTADCTCQYAVLLVYGSAAGPVVVTVHGRDDEAYVRMVDDPADPDRPLADEVMAALMEALVTRSPARGVPMDASAGSASSA